MKARQKAGNNNPVGWNGKQRDTAATLEGIMQQLLKGPVTRFDVALIQNVSENWAGELMASLEKAGIVQEKRTRVTRVKDDKAVQRAVKSWELTAAYHKGLAVFDPLRLVGIGNMSRGRARA